MMASDATIQIAAARVDRGDLGSVAVWIGGGERAMVGDIVATRRNDRTIVTTAGEPIRNRELWQVSEVDDDGSLTVSAIGRHGTAVLPGRKQGTREKGLNSRCLLLEGCRQKLGAVKTI